MAWKYTPGRLVLSGFIVLVILRAIKLLSDVHISTRLVDGNAITREAVQHLCTYSAADVTSLIWSHRAHHPNVEIDASKEAVSELLSAGIRNFDVDVSCKTVPNSDKCEFVIAHPTMFADKDKLDQRKHVQSVTAFLEQIFLWTESEVRPGTTASRLRPLITLEMKFTQSIQQIEFVKLVQESRLASHVAIIGTDPSILQHLVPHLTHSGLAAAYRSKPFTTHDYSWPEASYNEWQTVQSGWMFNGEETVSKSFTPVPPPLIVHSTSINTLSKTESTPQILSDASSTSNTILESELSVPADSQTIQVESGPARNYLQVYMPDAKLLKHQLLWQRISERLHYTGDNESTATQKSPMSKHSNSGSVTGDVVGATISSASSKESNVAGSTPVGGVSSHDKVLRRDAHSIVVVWVVDTVEGLWSAVGKGVDGVISNQPVQLLEELKKAHMKYCIAGV